MELRVDLDAVADELARRFIQRRDVKAVQNPDGTWRPDRTEWTKGDLRRHLRKEVVHGHYLVDADGRCKLVALDIDLDKGGPRERWQSRDGETKVKDRQTLGRGMLALAFGLAYRANRLFGVPATVAYSGSKGMHVYAFLGSVDANEARTVAAILLGDGTEDEPWHKVRGDAFWKTPAFPDFTVEVFPKQDEVGAGGLGNLMRLPLGHNYKGDHLPVPFNRPTFMAEANLQWRVDDPLLALREGSTRFASEPWVGAT